MNSNTTKTSIAPSITPASPKSNKGRNAGIGMGVTIIAICAALGAWFIYKRRKRPIPSGEGEGISADGGWGQGIDKHEEQGIDAEQHEKDGGLRIPVAEVANQPDYGIAQGPVEVQKSFRLPIGLFGNRRKDGSESATQTTETKTVFDFFTQLPLWKRVRRASGVKPTTAKQE
ncbi:MAG: hypothetical protein M1812_003689 [Candelaria pacifica]|nr:MAG: hypothetical protein M1812_003689 [Candelaria pacifica]